MKSCKPSPPVYFQRLLLLPGVLSLFLLTSCSVEKRDRLWQTLDPAGYKHAHSESFNGVRALRSPQPSAPSETDDIPLDPNQ